MKWILTTLLLLTISGTSWGLEFKTLAGTTISTTLIDEFSLEERRFANAVALHFTGAKECWKQRVIPKQSTINNVVVGTILACRRFWPGQPEKMFQFFSLVVSESGGNNTGNPNDPSYGVCHVTTASAHNACVVWGIPHPRNSNLCDSRCYGIHYRSSVSFLHLLANDLLFNLMCGAGEAAIANIKSNGDWVKAVLIYKFGERGYVNAMQRLGDKPITEIKSKNGQYIWKNYNRVYLWMTCINERASGDSITRCGCLPQEVSTK
jgi:hypothetical protein